MLTLHVEQHLFGNERSDIYVMSAGERTATNVTNGTNDGAGYWSPAWSPDGRRLAMLSTKGGNVYLWSWDETSGKLRQLTGRAVDLYDPRERPYTWISPTRLLVPVLPENEKPTAFLGAMRTAERVMTAWRRAWRAEGVTASVLESGVKPDLTRRPEGELWDVDVQTGTHRVVAHGSARQVVVSSDGQSVAFLRRIEVNQPVADRPLQFDVTFGAGTFELQVVSSESTNMLPADRATFDVLPTSLRWSPDGEELAFLTYTRNRTPAPRIARFQRSTRRIIVAQTGTIDPFPLVRQTVQIEWTSKGWMVLAAPISDDAARRAYLRRDWYLVSDGGMPRNLTERMPLVPSKLWRAPGRDAYVGLADGDLWRINQAASPENLTRDFARAISSIVWPKASTEASDVEAVYDLGQTYRRLIVAVPDGAEQKLHVADSLSGALTELSSPAPGAAVAAYSQTTGAAVYLSNDRTGLRAWLARDGVTTPSLVFEANGFLKNIAVGSYRRLDYRTWDGTQAIAWTLLPPNYDSAKRYPLMVYPYPLQQSAVAGGTVVSETTLNLQIAAAAGYAVLRPSVLLEPEGTFDDPLPKVTAGVMPAIDKAIELGIADPDRLFVLGTSLGGYSTYALITQTDRFKAAVATAGLSNLVSGYLQFDTVERYDEFPHESASNQAAVIETPLRLRAPPWKDLGRYVRNSPIFHVDRVKTPVLIIHGDLDGVPIEQAEEFFMALYRQGKRAQFVRYWGEGHEILSPPNVRDMWKRIFAWFEEFSKPTTSSHQPPGRKPH